ncbi:MAG: hypothetical protein ACR2KU_07375 [Gammaproteobacteria bacterium]
MGSAYYFRVCAGDCSFTDYEILLDDLSITIAKDELAAFYQIGDRFILDYDPQALGLKKNLEDCKRTATLFRAMPSISTFPIPMKLAVVIRNKTLRPH